MADAGAELRALSEAVVETVVETSGELSPEARRAAHQLGAGQATADLVPEDLRALATTMAERPWATTDAQVAEAVAAQNEDTVYEPILAVAVGAGAGRLARGLTALEEARP